MSTLTNLKPNIKYLLERYPVLRDDDFLLIGSVYNHYYGVDHEAHFLDVMKHHKELGLPSFESVRRTRQKVQEEFPALGSSKAKKKERQMAFDEFYEFAKS